MEKRVIFPPSFYGSKAEKKAFRFEERQRWMAMMDREKKEQAIKDLQIQQKHEREDMQRRHHREMRDLINQPCAEEKMSSTFDSSPLSCEEQETGDDGWREREMDRRRRRAAEMAVLMDTSWDDDNNYTSPLEHIRKEMKKIIF